MTTAINLLTDYSDNIEGMASEALYLCESYEYDEEDGLSLYIFEDSQLTIEDAGEAYE